MLEVIDNKVVITGAPVTPVSTFTLDELVNIKAECERKCAVLQAEMDNHQASIVDLTAKIADARTKGAKDAEEVKAEAAAALEALNPA